MLRERIKVRRAFTVVSFYSQAHSFVVSVKQVRKYRMISAIWEEPGECRFSPSAASLLLRDPAVSSYLSTGAKYLLLKMKRITFHPRHCSRRHLACVRGASVCICVCVCLCKCVCTRIHVWVFVWCKNTVASEAAADLCGVVVLAAFLTLHRFVRSLRH